MQPFSCLLILSSVLFGCSPSEVDYNLVQDRNGIVYLPNGSEPFTWTAVVTSSGGGVNTGIPLIPLIPVIPIVPYQPSVSAASRVINIVKVALLGLGLPGRYGMFGRRVGTYVHRGHFPAKCSGWRCPFVAFHHAITELFCRYSVLDSTV